METYGDLWRAYGDQWRPMETYGEPHREPWRVSIEDLAKELAKRRRNLVIPNWYNKNTFIISLR